MLTFEFPSATKAEDFSEAVGPVGWVALNHRVVDVSDDDADGEPHVRELAEAFGGREVQS